MEDSVNGQARVYLQPIAAPSILGLYAFAGSTLIVAAELAGWYGSSQTALSDEEGQGGAGGRGGRRRAGGHARPVSRPRFPAGGARPMRSLVPNGPPGEGSA